MADPDAVEGGALTATGFRAEDAFLGVHSSVTGNRWVSRKASDEVATEIASRTGLPAPVARAPNFPPGSSPNIRPEREKGSAQLNFPAAGCLPPPPSPASVRSRS